MVPRIRPSLIGLPSYAAGRKVSGATLLASNECPYGLLPAVAARLACAAPAAFRYPDMACGTLVEALAAHHGVAAERIAVAAGSTEVCGQLLHTVVDPGDEVILGWRSFEAYPLLTAVAGGTAVRVPLHEDALDLDAMLASVTRRTRLIFVCNPNNPTGTAVGAEDLLRFLAVVSDDILVVIDEAYREYADPALVPDAFDLLGERRNVVVLRPAPRPREGRCCRPHSWYACASAAARWRPSPRTAVSPSTCCTTGRDTPRRCSRPPCRTGSGRCPGAPRRRGFPGWTRTRSRSQSAR
jgi:histidinol-phosphate aminotransferase